MVRGKKSYRKFYSILIRYLLAIIVGIPNLFLFYFIFTPLTIYPLYFILGIFFDTSLSGIIISINSSLIYLVDACIAGSAYYLLFILNMVTPMNLRKRLYSLLFLFTTFLVVNILRIFIFSIFFVNSFDLFKIAHLFTWYALSGVIVFLIWLANIKLFKIKSIPLYTDLRFLHKIIKKN